MKLKVANEEVICHMDEIEFTGRPPKIEFRVQIRFEDEEGHDYWIDHVYEAAPKRDKRRAR